MRLRGIPGFSITRKEEDFRFTKTRPRRQVSGSVPDLFSGKALFVKSELQCQGAAGTRDGKSEQGTL